MSEKRKESRVLKTIRAEVHTGDGMTFSSSVDISTKGIFISTPEPIAPKTEITLNIQLTQTDTIMIKGLVRWNRDENDSAKAGVGIEFIDVSEVALNIIKNLCG
jgi:hypothetical protein